MCTLTVEVPGHAPRRVQTDKPTINIGRHPDCDLVLSHSMVSRYHARLLRRADGYEIEDLDSRNGTALNGIKIDAPTRVSPGDCIGIDLATIVLTDEGQEEARRGTVGRSQSDDAVGDGLPLIDKRQLLQETASDIECPSADVLEKAVAPRVRLHALLEISRDLGHSLDVDSSLAGVLDSVFRAFPQAERGYILECDELTGEISIVEVKDRHALRGKDLTLGPLFHKIVRRVLRNGEALLSASDEGMPASASKSVLDVRSPSVLCAPIIGPSRQPLGAIYVESDKTHFDTEGLDVLSCIAILTGQTLEQTSLQTARYRAVVNTAADAILTVDDHGTIASANPAVERLFGYDAKELIGDNVRRLMDLSSEDLHDELIGQLLNRSADHGQGREVVGKRKDGSGFPVNLSVGEFQLDSQHFFTVLLRDISEQKRSQRELQELNETLERRVEKRTASVRLLQKVASIANEAESVSQALRWALASIGRMCDWPIGHAWLPDADDPNVFCDSGLWFGEGSPLCAELKDTVQSLRFRSGTGIVGRVIESGKPMWISNVSGHESLVAIEAYRALGVCSAFAFPVLVEKEVAAVLEFFMSEDPTPDAEFLRAIAHAGTQLGRVVERSRMQRQLVDAVWTQQRRFGQEVHDSLGQELTGIRMLTEGVCRKLEKQPIKATEAALDELTALIHNVQDHARQISKGLFPVDVFEGSLAAALDELAASVGNQSGISCLVRCESGVDVDDHEVATHLFRIAQEAANNAVKYSGGDRVEISLRRQDRHLLLEVRDNGTGMAQDGENNGIGLRIMRYRATAIGGRLTVRSRERAGTTVRCAVKTVQ